MIMLANSPPPPPSLPYHPDEVLIHKQHDATLQTLTITCGLIDILALHHSARPFPPTNIRGKRDQLHVSFCVLAEISNLFQNPPLQLYF
jgi:hypothetical protein